MKKFSLSILVAAIVLFGNNVYACGEIKELKSDVGTVSLVDESNFLVTVPEGTAEVTLSGVTDYAWVDGYAPRKVSTKGEVELKVDGNSCGYGIYTYFVKFKTLSNVIAETPVTVTEDENSATVEETPNTLDIDYGTLKLNTLRIAETDFVFDPDTREYNLKVASNVTKLDITAESEPAITIAISEVANDLQVGENVVRVALVDAEGQTGLYIINVERETTKSSNNFLASITVEGYQLNFDPSITSYTLEIGKESSLNINVVPESELANYVILGNVNLVDGSTITIRVTAEDKTTKDYIININRVFNIMDYWVYIVIILLVLLLVILLIIFKQKKKKKKIGPAELEAQKETAGVVQEFAPQNLSSENAETANQNETTLSSSTTTPGTLKIIEPTNVETPVEEATPNADESSTEVFKL